MPRNLKIFIVTQLDPVYVSSFFDELFNILEMKNLKLILEIFDMPNFNEDKISLFKRLIKFYGFFDFIKLLGIYLNEVFYKRKFKKFKQYLKVKNIKFHKINSVNNNLFINYVKNQKPDLILSVSAPEIFKEKLLSLNNIQFVNIHCAPLPRYKGMMPNFWQKLNNEIYSAITIHEISNKIDTGSILYQKKYDLLQTDSLHNNIIRAKKLSALALLEFLYKDIIKTKIYLKDNYFSFPRKENVKIFKKSKKNFF